MSDQPEIVEGPGNSKKSILVMVDPVEAAVIRHALGVFLQAEDRPDYVQDIARKLDAAFRWSLA